MNLQTTISNLMKMAGTSPKGTKHCGKRVNCSSRAIVPFPPRVFKIFVLQARKNKGLFEKGFKMCTGNFYAMFEKGFKMCTGNVYAMQYLFDEN